MLRRAVWLLLGLAHAPALLNVWSRLFASGFAAEHLTGCAGLTLSTLFFALKVQDVAFLRFRTDLRSCVALFTIVAFLHVDLVRPADSPTPLPACTGLVATTWLAAGIPSVRRAFKDLWTCARHPFQRVSSLARSAGIVWLDAFHPHCWVLIPNLSTPRGPPV